MLGNNMMMANALGGPQQPSGVMPMQPGAPQPGAPQPTPQMGAPQPQSGMAGGPLAGSPMPQPPPMGTGQSFPQLPPGMQMPPGMQLPPMQQPGAPTTLSPAMQAQAAQWKQTHQGPWTPGWQPGQGMNMPHMWQPGQQWQPGQFRQQMQQFNQQFPNANLGGGMLGTQPPQGMPMNPFAHNPTGTG